MNCQPSTLEMPTAAYAGLVSRNAGFIPENVQEKLRRTRVLIAGCGLGGVIAEVAVRTGFAHLGLIDGDHIEGHNLNRQMFTSLDVGHLKAQALARHLREISPEAEILDFNVMIDADNARDFVSQYDLVIDTVDFRDPCAIRALHTEARAQNKTVIAPLAVGWGGAALVFPPDGPSLAELMGSQGSGNEPAQYVDTFATMMRRYANVFPEYAVRVISRILETREICPFSQIGAGNFAAASLTVMLAVRILAGEKVPCAPKMLLIDPMSNPIVCDPLVA
jgi:molybdopterin-synthase adenylyltransferase